MSTLAQRATVLELISQACSAGARLHKACAVIGLAARTVQRWVDAGKNALHVGDRSFLISIFITARPTNSATLNAKPLWAC